MMTDRRALALLCTVVVLLSAGVLAGTGAVQAAGDDTPEPIATGSGIHIDPAKGDDTNDGLTADTAVKTLDRARGLADGVPIIVHGEISIGESISPYTLEGETLQRAEGYTGKIINIANGAELTVSNTTIDGMNLEATGSLIHAGQGTLNIGDGTVLRNNGYTAVSIWNGGGVLNMTSGEIYGNTSPEDGGAILVNNAKAVITGGSIHDNSTAKSGGAIALLSGKLTVGEVEIHDNESEGTHTATSYAGRSSYYGGGGAIYAEANSSNDATVVIDGANIHDNSAKGVGGAIIVYDGGQYNSVEATVSDVTVTGNTAGDGSAMYIDRGQYSKNFPAVEIAGENDISGDIALRYIDDTTGPVLTIGDNFSNSASIAITFTDAIPTGVFATGSADAADFTVEGYIVTQTEEGLALTQIPEMDQVYLDPVNGSDSDFGESREKAVKSLDRAMLLAGDKPIIVCNAIEIGSDVSPYTLEGASLQRADGYTGYIIYVKIGAELTVRNTVIDGLNHEADGALIHTQKGKVTLEEGTILRNNGYTAVTLANNGSVFIMNGGEISGNSSDIDGGAVNIFGGRMEMNGGSIHDNTTSASGGAIALIGARLSMNGGEITGNGSTGTTVDTTLETNSQLPGGGAIYAETCKHGKAQVMITGGTIIDNTASADGGAILVFNGYMYGAKQDTWLDISGGRIAENTADGSGNAIWIGYDSDALHIPALRMSGTPQIDSDVYLFGTGTTGVQITIQEEFAPSEAVDISFPEMPQYAFAVGTTDASAFNCDGYMIIATENRLIIDEMPEFNEIYLDPKNGSDSNYGLEPATAVQSLDRARELAGDKPINVMGEVEIRKDMSPYVLEGANLQRADGYTGYILYVMYGAELTVRNTAIDGMGYDAEKALIHTQQGKVTLEDGTIIRNNGFTAVTLANNGSVLIMNGGEIYGNRSDSDGAAIHIYGGRMEMNGGSIHDNTTSASGGAIALIGARLVMNDGEISGNSSTGTAVDTILDTNSQLPGGGAIYAETCRHGKAQVTITGGNITGNTTSADGGAILVFNGYKYGAKQDTWLDISGGIISENTAGGYGNAVWIGYDSDALHIPAFRISGTPTIVGDVYLYGTGAQGIQISAGEGFEPSNAIAINFPVKPAYTIVTGDAVAKDFTAVGEKYTVMNGTGGLVVGDKTTSTDEEGNTVTKDTFTETDSEGNEITTTVTTVTDTKGNVSEITTDVDGVSVTTDFSDEGAKTQITGGDIDAQISIAVGNMSSYEGEKTVVIGSDGTVSVSSESVKALADAGASIGFVSGRFSVEMDGTTAGTVTDDVEFSATTELEGIVTEAQKDVIGGAYGFDVSLDATFTGSVSVTVPYTLPSGMDASTITVWYVADDGSKTEMDTAYANGQVTFTTTHFSVYMITAEPEETPVTPGGGDDPWEPDFPDHPSVPVIPGGDDPVVTPPTIIMGGSEDSGLTTTETAIVIVLGVLTAVAAVVLVYGLRRS